MKLIDYKEAASRLAVPIGTLRVMVSRRTVPHVRLGPRMVKFDPDVLAAWIADKTKAVVEAPRAPHRGGGGASDLHEHAIDRLAPVAARSGFPRELTARTGVAIAHADLVVPDAFEFDDASRCLSIYEVERWHPLTERKMRRLRSLRDLLSKANWSLRLFAAHVSDRAMTELDIETGCLTGDEIEGIIARDHVRFVLP